MGKHTQEIEKLHDASPTLKTSQTEFNNFVSPKNDISVSFYNSVQTLPKSDPAPYTDVSPEKLKSKYESNASFTTEEKAMSPSRRTGDPSLALDKANLVI